MNLAVCDNTWTEGLRSKLRMLVLFVFFLFPIVSRTMEFCARKEFPSERFSGPALAVCFVLVWGCGTIGRHVQDGTLALVLSRPITIKQFVLSKWFAVAAASSIVSILQLGAETIVAYSWMPRFDPSEIWINGTERLMICFGFAAVLMLFSSLVNGAKDLGLYLLVLFLQSICGAVASLDSQETKDHLLRKLIDVAAQAAEWMAGIFSNCLEPNVALRPWISSGTIPWYEIAFYFAVITGALSLSIIALNRKELPYGSA